MEEIVDDLTQMVTSFEDPKDPRALIAECDEQLIGVKENVGIVLTAMPDIVAFGLYPYITTDEKINMFFNQYDIFCDDLPNLEEVRKQKFFGVDKKEADFVRSIMMMNETAVIKILFAIAWVRANKK